MEGQTRSLSGQSKVKWLAHLPCFTKVHCSERKRAHLDRRRWGEQAMPPEGRLGFRGCVHVEGLVELLKVLVIACWKEAPARLCERLFISVSPLWKSGDAPKWISTACFPALSIIHCADGKYVRTLRYYLGLDPSGYDDDDEMMKILMHAGRWPMA